MCGIFGYVGGGDATSIVFDGLKNLEYRGYDSWGIASIHSKKIFVQKQIGKIGSSKLERVHSHISIGHTRWATHGGVTTQNSHPHYDCHKQLVVVHNGIIENYEELKTALIKQGHQFISATDTEVFSHQVEEELKSKDFVTAVKSSFGKIRGLNTIVVMNREGDIVACKNGSSLVIGKGNNKEIYLSSDLPSLLGYTKRVAILDDLEVGVIIGGILTSNHNFNLINMEAGLADKGDYPHYYLKEIHDQPISLRRRSQADREEFARQKPYCHKLAMFTSLVVEQLFTRCFLLPIYSHSMLASMRLQSPPTNLLRLSHCLDRIRW